MLQELTYQIGPILPFQQQNPTYDNRQLWNSIQDNIKYELLMYGKILLNYKFMQLPASLFMEYSSTGNETSYMHLFDQKRVNLLRLTLAECIEYDNKFIPSILDGIYSILTEPCWHSPSSQNALLGSKYPLPDLTQVVLDRPTTGTASLLASIYVVMGEYFDHISPSINHNILTTINKRIIEPFLESDPAWYCNEENPNDRTMPLCCNHLLFCILSLPLPSQIAKKVLKKITICLDYYYDHLSKDGCCTEGIHYYKTGILSFFSCLDQLGMIATDSLDPILNAAKTKALADYIRTIHIDGSSYVAFGPSNTVGPQASIFEYYIGKMVHHTPLCNFAASQYTTQTRPSVPFDTLPNNIVTCLQSFYLHRDIMNYPIQKEHLYSNYYYGSSGLFIARNSTYTVAVFAGKNTKMGHHDIGSFLLYKNGVPFIIDIGRCGSNVEQEEMVSSYYHNVAIVNGELQKDGVTFRAKNVKVSLRKDSPSISMDLCNVYAKRSKLTYYNRTITLKEDGLSINDDAHFSENQLNISTQYSCPTFAMSIMTNDPPSFSNGVLTVGTIGTMEITNVFSCTISEIPVTKDSSCSAWNGLVYHCYLCISSNNFSMKFK